MPDFSQRSHLSTSTNYRTPAAQTSRPACISAWASGLQAGTSPIPRKMGPSVVLARGTRPKSEYHPSTKPQRKSPDYQGFPSTGATGLEPAASGVTGRRSNQLSYAPAWRDAGGEASRLDACRQQYAQASPGEAGDGRHVSPNWPGSQEWGRLRDDARRPAAPEAVQPIRGDGGRLRKERASRVPYPPGETSFSMARTRRFADDRCRCCWSATSATGRCSRSKCCTATSCSCSGRRPTTT